MNDFINSCQLASHSFWSHQQLHWYGLILISVLGTKLLFSWLKAYFDLQELTKKQVETPTVLRKLAHRHHVSSEQLVVIDDARLMALTVGWPQTKIVLSQSLVDHLPESELESILLHEVYHLQSRHPLWLLISKSLTSLLFFVPTLEDFLQYQTTQWELQADHFSVTKQKTRRHLEQALATCLHPAPASALGFHTQRLEERISQLVSGHSQLRLRLSLPKLAISLVSILGLSLFSLKAHQVQAQVTSAPLSSQCTFTQCVSECVAQQLLGERMSQAPVSSPAGPAFSEVK